MSTFMSAPESQAQPATSSNWDRMILVVLTAVGAMIGLAPVVTYFKQPLYLPAFAVWGALFAWASIGKDVPAGSQRPGLLHFSVALLSSLFLWGLLGMIWFGFYYMVYGTCWLIGYLVKFDYHQWAFYVSLLFSALFGIGIANQCMTRMKSLLQAEGLRYMRGGKALLCVAAPLVIAALEALGLWYFWGDRMGSVAPFMVLQFLPYMGGIPALTLEQSVGKQVNTIEAISKLFESAGYTVVRPQRNEDTLIGSVVSKLDLIAYDDSRLFAAEVKTKADSTKPVDWSTAFSLRTRVKALEHNYYEHWPASQEHGPDLRGRRVRPLLILVDREMDESLATLLGSEEMPVIKLDGGLVREVTETNDPERLREIARERLRGIDMTDASAAGAS